MIDFTSITQNINIRITFCYKKNAITPIDFIIKDLQDDVIMNAIDAILTI